MSALDTIVAPLFVPANQPGRFAKAAASGADAIILDLEDAVSADEKASARANLTADLGGLPVLVRINAAGTPWHADDLAAVARLPLAGIMLPKAEDGAVVSRVGEVHRVVALIESARGIAHARELAALEGVARLAFGSIDYAADLGCAHEREALLGARTELVLASRLAGLPQPIDGVTAEFRDDARSSDDARYARSLGFAGKLAIHPAQIAAIVQGFLPSEQEIAWAARVLAGGDGAVAIDGMMVDEPVRIRARQILARAAARSGSGAS